MYRILIFSCLWHFSLSEQNITELQIHTIQYDTGSENITLERLLRASNRPRGEKPVDCHKLHGTDDSAFVAIILNKYSGRLLCMGSIIDERHILTANPCVLNIDIKNLRVLLGYFKAWWGRHSYVHYVEKILKHEHDLVILRLTRLITFSRTVRPIRLLRVEDGDPNATEKPPAASNATRNQEDVGNQTLRNPPPPHHHNAKGVTPTSEDDSKSNIKEESRANNSKLETEGRHNNKNQQMDLNEEKKENITITNNSSNIVSHNHNKHNKTVNSGRKSKEKNHEHHAEDAEKSHEGKEVEIKQPQSGSKVYQGTKRKKISKRQTPKIIEFEKKHSTIKKILLVGFPLSRFEVQGEPISQTIIYSMKEEEVKPAKDCVDLYHLKPLPQDDKDNKESRDFCSAGTSKLCWGCLGGPTLFKKDNEYIQVGVVGGANCDDDKTITPYLHIRVDIHMNWILANSLIPPKL